MPGFRDESDVRQQHLLEGLVRSVILLYRIEVEEKREEVRIVRPLIGIVLFYEG